MYKSKRKFSLVHNMSTYGVSFHLIHQKVDLETLLCNSARYLVFPHAEGTTAAWRCDSQSLKTENLASYRSICPQTIPTASYVCY